MRLDWPVEESRYFVVKAPTEVPVNTPRTQAKSELVDKTTVPANGAVHVHHNEFRMAPGSPVSEVAPMFEAVTETESPLRLARLANMSLAAGVTSMRLIEKGPTSLKYESTAIW